MSLFLVAKVLKIPENEKQTRNKNTANKKQSSADTRSKHRLVKPYIVFNNQCITFHLLAIFYHSHISLYKFGYIEEAYLAHRALRYNIKGRETLAGSCKYYMNDLAFKNYLYAGTGYGIEYLLENLVYLELSRHGYDVYVGSIKDKEVDFVAIKNDRFLYVQVTYMSPL